jgi:site-specific DNA recombinase
MKTITQVAIYARVSCEQQVTTCTIDSQLEALKTQVQADGFSLQAHLQFIDEGFSGSTLVRPALERLRDAVAKGEIDRLYVHSPDRLSRKYAYQVILVDEFQKNGIEVFFLNHQLGKSPEDELLLQVQGMVAEYERAKIIERSRRGKRHAASSGSLNAFSKAPYGYRHISKHLGGGQVRMEIHLAEARIVQQIFEWAVYEHMTLRGICQRLEAMCVPSPKGKSVWDSSSIRRILNNPHYKGEACFGRLRQGPKISRLRPPRNSSAHARSYSTYKTPPEDWIIVPVAAIIDQELFAAAQEKLSESCRRSRQRIQGASYLLQGLTVCGVCGYAYVHSIKRPTRNGKVYEYYRCYTRKLSDGSRCSNVSVVAESIEEAVWIEVCKLLKNPQSLQQEYQRRLNNCDEDHLTKQIRTIQSQKGKLEQGIGRIIDTYTEGLIEKDEFEPRLKGLRERLRNIETQLQTLHNEASLVGELKVVVGRVEEFAAKVVERLESLDWQSKREVIRTLVKRIEVYPEQVKVVFRVSSGPLVPRPNEESSSNCGVRIGDISNPSLVGLGHRKLACQMVLHHR